LQLREITREIIATLEKKSGYIVDVKEDPNLATLANIRIARGNLPAHILTYRPGAKDDSPDFAIIWQCALALRMYECSPEKRFLIASAPEGDRALESILRSPDGIAQKYQLGETQLDSFKSQLFNGLITHLRSVPIGLRVSETLTLDYPDLLELEVKHVKKELALAKETRTANVKAMIPAEIYNPTQYINAAYAIFWAGRLEKPSIVNPFRLEGFEVHGQKLLNIFDKISNEPTNDYELIDRWADYLTIHSWYTWLPYQVP
jgi:hypothetical protein